MGTDGGGTRADRASADDLVAEILKLAKDRQRRISRIADELGIARSTVSRWQNGAVPRTFHVQLVGAALERRLEWRPKDPHWLGADFASHAAPPAPLAMLDEPAAPQDPSDLRAVAARDAYFLSAEARWARIYLKSWSLDDCPGDRHAWAAFERGPIQPAPGAKPVRAQSSPLATAAFVGRCLGLELFWAKRDDPYRVRPWEVQNPPPPNDSIVALAQEQRRRPRLW